MKKCLVIFAVFVLSVLGNPAAYADYTYLIDGDVSDWGVMLNADSAHAGYLNSHLPQSATADYSVNDQVDNSMKGWIKINPGYTYGGTSGGKTYLANSFDAEAMYFDNDDTYAYICLVSGMPLSGATAPSNPWFLPGDIAIGTQAGVYNFGIDVSSFDAAAMVANLYEGTGMWQHTSCYAAGNPWAVDPGKGTSLGVVEFFYSAEPQYGHYVAEVKVPLATLGLTSDSEDSVWLHWTMQCGNNVVNLKADVDETPVPEPASMALLAPALFGLAAYYRKKRKAA